MAALSLTLLLLPGSALSPNAEPIQAGAALLYPAIASVAAALSESVSLAGTD